MNRSKIDEIFEQYVSGALAEAIAAIEDNIIREVASRITGLTRDEIVEFARERTADLVTRALEQAKDNMRRIISEGLEAQQGVDGIARRLRYGLGLDSVREKQLDNFGRELIQGGIDPNSAMYQERMEREYKRLERERAETIARTETRRAMEWGEKVTAQKGGATHKMWITVADDKVSDVCAENEAAGVIPIGESFPSGDDEPPGHPNCRCTLAYVDSNDGEAFELAQEDHRAQIEDTEEARANDEE